MEPVSTLACMMLTIGNTSWKECIGGRGTWQLAFSQVSLQSLFMFWRGVIDENNTPVQFVLFAVSTGNSISFSSYILRAATLSSYNGSWLNRGIAVAAITGMCGWRCFLLGLP
jgi:hypothetical protein